MARELWARLFSLSTRQVVAFVGAVNAIAVVGAFLVTGLPGWPPGPHDIHITDQIGSPLVTFAGAGNQTTLLSAITLVFDLSVSNSLFTMWLVMAVLVVLSWAATRRLAEVPGKVQGLLELIAQGLADFMRSAGGPGVVRFLPLFGTLLLLLVLCNWLSIVPFVGQIELLHSPTADYNINLGLAITGFVVYQAAGIRTLGWSYFTRWINFSGFKDGVFVGVIMLVMVGPLELFSELFRILTLTLRLWGNIWGGEITLSVITALLFVPSLPLPFVGLEIFIGFVQAFIFSFLVLLYIIMALESHGEEHAEEFDQGHIGPLERAREVAHA